MPNKIKLFFSFLGLIALFSVYSVFNSLSGQPAPIAVIGAQIPLPGFDADVDHDGLANREESYWNTDFQNPDTDGDGFMDGEEVASGHDPLKPGPNDILNESKNITKNLAELITAGLYAKDLKPGLDGKKYDKAVSDLSLAVIDDFYKTQTNTDFIQLNLVDNSKENQKVYLEVIAKSIKENILDFPEKIDTTKNPGQQSEFFLGKSNRYKNSHDTLSKIPVPKDWKLIHEAMLSILKRLAINYFFIGSYNLDPIKSFLSLNEVQQNIDPEIKLLLKQIQIKIQQNKLVLDTDFYNILSLIYK